MIGALPSITGSVGRVARTVYATGTGTHTFNTSATRFKLTMCGAAGGMYAASAFVAGGAGATEFLDLPVTLAALPYAIGAGGGGSVDGGDTTFGQWKANGGKAGTSGVGGVGGSANYPNGVSGGDGGVFSAAGNGPGNVSGLGGATGGTAGGGGSSALGRGGAGSASGGNPSTGYGAAAGAVAAGATVTSGGGVIIIEEYI